LEQELLKAKELFKEDKTKPHRERSASTKLSKVERGNARAQEEVTKLKSTVDALSADIEKKMEEARTVTVPARNKQDIELQKQNFEETFASLTKEFGIGTEAKKSKLKQKQAAEKDELAKKMKQDRERTEKAIKREEVTQKELLEKIEEVMNPGTANELVEDGK